MSEPLVTRIICVRTSVSYYLYILGSLFKSEGYDMSSLYTCYYDTNKCVGLLLVTVVIMASSASLRSHSHLIATDKMASIISSNASTIYIHKIMIYVCMHG